jgi:ABC-type lipoprotein export system ATPase subunit
MTALPMEAQIASSGTTADEPLVQCAGVGRTYGTGRAAVVALHDVTCAVLPGQRIALVGPSGSGKSTLLHLLAGLDTPTAGTISWPALGLRDSLRPGPVGVVFQGPSLLPPLDVVENVALPLLLAGVEREVATMSASDALARLGLVDLSGKLPEELSGGQAQRVAVARVLAGSPRLILADEPTGQLDLETGHRIMAVLRAVVASEGITAIVATHDQAMIDLADRVLELRDGALVPAT